MLPVRFLFPLLLAFALLFAQQGAAVHALGHILVEQAQQNKQAPHSPACEQCAAYAQLGGTLGSGAYSFTVEAAPGAAVQHHAAVFRSIPTLAAVARGPPALLQAFV